MRFLAFLIIYITVYILGAMHASAAPLNKPKYECTKNLDKEIKIFEAKADSKEQAKSKNKTIENRPKMIECIFYVEDRTRSRGDMISRTTDALELRDKLVYKKRNVIMGFIDHEVSVRHYNPVLLKEILNYFTYIDKIHYTPPANNIQLVIEFLYIKDTANDTFEIGVKNVAKNYPQDEGYNAWDSTMSLFNIKTSNMMWSAQVDNSKTLGWYADDDKVNIRAANNKYVHRVPLKRKSVLSGENIANQVDYETGLYINGRFTQSAENPNIIHADDLSIKKISNEPDNQNQNQAEGTPYKSELTLETGLSALNIDLKVGETRIIYLLEETIKYKTDSSGFFFYGDSLETGKVNTIITIRAVLPPKRLDNNLNLIEPTPIRNAKIFKPKPDINTQQAYKKILRDLMQMRIDQGTDTANNFGTIATMFFDNDDSLPKDIENTYIKVEIESEYLDNKFGGNKISEYMYLNEFSKGFPLPLIDPTKINANDKRVQYTVRVAFDDVHLNGYKGVYGAEYNIIYTLDDNVLNIQSEIIDVKIITDSGYIKELQGYKDVRSDSSSDYDFGDFEDDSEDDF